MNCDQFKERWPAYLSGTLPPAEIESVSGHAKVCQYCRRCWDDHHEVKNHLAAMVRLKDGTELATPIERDLSPQILIQPPRESITMDNASSTPSPPTSAGSTRLPSTATPTAVIAGVLFGIVLGIIGTSMFARTGSSSTIANLMELEMMMNGRMSRSARGALMGQNAMGNGMLNNVPILTGASKTVLCLLLIAGAARTKLWEAMSGNVVPPIVRAARAISLIVIILGIGLTAGTLYLRAFLIPKMMWAGSRGDDFGWMMTAHNVAMELWALACWVTIAFVLAGAVQIALRRSLPQTR